MTTTRLKPGETATITATKTRKGHGLWTWEFAVDYGTQGFTKSGTTWTRLGAWWQLRRLWRRHLIVKAPRKQPQNSHY